MSTQETAVETLTGLMGSGPGVSVGNGLESPRSATAYKATINGELQAMFGARYRMPTDEDVAHGAAERLAEWRYRLWAIVPLAETVVDEDCKIPVAIEGMARYVSARMRHDHFYVVNAGSHADNVNAARNGGAIVVEQDRVFDAVNWEQLLPILGRSKRPFRRSGKGFTVLAGHLVLAALGLPNNAVVFQTDAEISDYERYNPLERLLLVVDKERSTRHAKMAKHGRNNETTMAMRAALQNLFRLPIPWIPPNVATFAQELFEALGADKWMLTGEWLSRGDMVMGRPLATGYSEETFQAVWSVHSAQCGWQNVRYVANPHARADGANSPRKEDLMMESLSSFLLALALNGRPPCTWNLGDIAAFNDNVMSQLTTMPIIGQDNEPVHVHEIRPEGIIPPVNMLLRHGMVDLDVVRRAIAEATI